MSRLGVPTLGWLTAVLLCLITFWVFETLQYHGPESTLHQYHQAAARANQGLGNQLSTPDLRDEISMGLWNSAVGLMDQGRTRYAIIDSFRAPNEATMIVRYDTVVPVDSVVVWRLIRERGSWRIDARATMDLMKRFLSQ